MPPDALFTRGFATLFVAFFFCLLGVNLFAMLPYYLELRGEGPAVFGAAAGVQGLAAAVVTLWLGRHSDSGSRRRTAMGYFVPAWLAYLLALVAMDWGVGWYFVVLALQGVMLGVGLPILFVWASELGPAGRRTEVLGLFGIAGLVADSSGPALSEWLLHLGGQPRVAGHFSTIFIAANVLAPLCMLLLWLTPDGARRAASADTSRSGLSPLLANPSLRLGLLAASTFGGALGVMANLGKNFVTSIGLELVSVLFVAHTCGAVLSRLLLPALLRRHSRRGLMVAGFAGVSLSQLGLSLTAGYGLLGAAGFLYGVAHGVLFPTLMARFIDYGGEDAAGRVSVLYMGTFSLGFGLMPMSAALLLPRVGFQGLFVMTGLLCALGLLLALRAEGLRAAGALD